MAEKETQRQGQGQRQDPLEVERMTATGDSLKAAGTNRVGRLNEIIRENPDISNPQQRVELVAILKKFHPSQYPNESYEQYSARSNAYTQYLGSPSYQNMFKQYSTELSDKLDNPIKTAINEITTEVNRINEEAQSALATPKKQPATTSNELFKAFSAVVEWAKTGKPTVAFKVNEEKRRIIDDAESGKKSNL